MTKKKILIVDDSNTVRQLVSISLSRLNYAVLEATGVDEALKILEENPDIALVVSDVNMPGRSGLDMLEAVKAQPQWQAMPFVLLTTDTSPQAIARARAAGARAWMTKPFEPQVLINTVLKLVAADK